MASLPDPRDSLQGEGLAISERMLAERRARGGTLPGPYVALLHHPRLAEAVEALGRLLRFEGALPRDVYEFAVLSFAVDARVRYIWDEHVGPARQAGVPEGALVALESGTGVLPAPYATVRQAMQAFEEYRSLPADLQQAVIDLLGMQGLLELAAICGLYALLGHVVEGLDVHVHARATPPLAPEHWVH